MYGVTAVTTVRLCCLGMCIVRLWLYAGAARHWGTWGTFPPPPFREKGGGNSPPPSARKNSKIKEKLKKKGGKSKKSALRAEFTLNLPLFRLNLDKIELFQGSRPPNLSYLVKNRIFLRASETLFSNFSGGGPPPGGYRPLDPHFSSWKKLFPPPFKICTGRPWLHGRSMNKP